LRQWYPKKDAEIYIPDPSWPTHKSIAIQSGFKANTYKYYGPKTKGLDFEGLKADWDKIPDESILLVHVCAHNPTGVDPT